jgi:hypothetical protein
MFACFIGIDAKSKYKLVLIHISIKLQTKEKFNIFEYGLPEVKYQYSRKVK